MSFENWTIEDLIARCTDFDEMTLEMDREEFAALRRKITELKQAGSDEIGSWANDKNTPTSTPITPAAPDKKLTDDVLDEIITGAKTSMEQYLALSLKAEREVWRKEGPTDDERIMAIEGIHNCERCGDEGWVVGEMGITRCACGQAGNSPVIGIDMSSGQDHSVEVRYVAPPGYVMVPKEPTEDMCFAPDVPVGNKSWDGYQSSADMAECKAIYEAMLAAAPHEVSNEK